MSFSDELYKNIFRPFLFSYDAEKAHHLTFTLLDTIHNLGFSPILGQVFNIPKTSSPKTVAGINFPNQLGLAAGFDKNARLVMAWQELGFGHVEIGTVTPYPQDGNPKPRLFRLIDDQAIINRMGFNNEGAEVVAKRLKNLPQNRKIIIGGNIGKNKNTPNEQAHLDYIHCFQKLYGLVDYFTLNVSSPNTPGLRALQEHDSLQKLLELVDKENRKMSTHVPVMLKVAPDLSLEQTHQIAQILLQSPISGLVVSNTTIARSPLTANPSYVQNLGAGGLSGLPLQEKSRNITKDFAQLLGIKVPIISVGGIDSAQEAQIRLNSGASLLQVYTAYVYKGPSLVSEILRQCS